MKYHVVGSPEPRRQRLKVNLVAVQATTEHNDYASAEAFHAKMSALFAEAMRDVDGQEIVAATVEVDGRG